MYLTFRDLAGQVIKFIDFWPELWKESLNSNGQQFHQYQQNKQSPFTLVNWTQKTPWHMTLEIQVLAWGVYKNMGGSLNYTTITLCFGGNVWPDVYLLMPKKTWFGFMVFKTTFNNISAISWQIVLLMEETGANHRPVAGHWQNLSHNVVSSTPRLCRFRTHNVSGDRHWLHM